jgi:hypothetical protein
MEDSTAVILLNLTASSPGYEFSRQLLTPKKGITPNNLVTSDWLKKLSEKVPNFTNAIARIYSVSQTKVREFGEKLRLIQKQEAELKEAQKKENLTEENKKVLGECALILAAQKIIAERAIAEIPHRFDNLVRASCQKLAELRLHRGAEYLLREHDVEHKREEIQVAAAQQTEAQERAHQEGDEMFEAWEKGQTFEEGMDEEKLNQLEKLFKESLGAEQAGKELDVNNVKLRDSLADQLHKLTGLDPLKNAQVKDILGAAKPLAEKMGKAAEEAVKTLTEASSPKLTPK